MKTKELSLRDFIVPTTLDNTPSGYRTNPDYSFNTRDFIFIEDIEEVKSFDRYDIKGVSATDYAVMNGARCEKGTFLGKTEYRLRSFFQKTEESEGLIDFVIQNGKIIQKLPNPSIRHAYCPAMHLDISLVISALETTPNIFSIEKSKEGSYHTIEFGKFPQDKEDFSGIKNMPRRLKLTPTGKCYTGMPQQSEKDFEKHEEFSINEEKYAKVVSSQHKGNDSNQTSYAKIQPIKWIIKNWDELPKELNPYGTGEATTIYIRSEKAIIGEMPFSLYYSDYTNCLWQNSLKRAYLNGYDLRSEIAQGNGNPDYLSNELIYNPELYSFSQMGFISEAFSDKVFVKEKEEQVENEKSLDNKEFLTLEMLKQRREQLIKNELSGKNSGLFFDTLIQLEEQISSFEKNGTVFEGINSTEYIEQERQDKVEGEIKDSSTESPSTKEINESETDKRDYNQLEEQKSDVPTIQQSAENDVQQEQ